jgi:hypothetical protein
VRQLELLRSHYAEENRLRERATDIAFEAHNTAMQAALASADKAVSAALASIREATSVQTESLKERADIQNKWRETVTDILTTAMPRAEAEQMALRLGERISEITSQVQHYPTRSEMQALYDRQAEQIRELTDWRNRVEGQGVGAKDNKAGIYAAIAAVGVVITIVVVIANFIAGG